MRTRNDPNSVRRPFMMNPDPETLNQVKSLTEDSAAPAHAHARAHRPAGSPESRARDGNRKRRVRSSLFVAREWRANSGKGK